MQNKARTSDWCRAGNTCNNHHDKPYPSAEPTLQWFLCCMARISSLMRCPMSPSPPRPAEASAISTRPES